MEADLEGERITKMEHTLANHDFGKKDVNVDIAIKHRKDCESALWAKSALFKVSFY